MEAADKLLPTRSNLWLLSLDAHTESTSMSINKGQTYTQALRNDQSPDSSGETWGHCKGALSHKLAKCDKICRWEVLLFPQLRGKKKVCKCFNRAY